MTQSNNYGMRQYQFVDRIRIKLKTKELLRIAGDDETTGMVCDSDGRPLIPGTSIAGTVRNYIMKHGELREQYGYLFGEIIAENREREKNPTYCDSKLYFYDSPLEYDNLEDLEQYLEERTENRHDSLLGGSKGNELHTNKYLRKGKSFTICIEGFSYDSDEQKKMKSMFQIILGGIQEGAILFGSRKNSGCGLMELIENQYTSVDLADSEQLKAYLLEKEENRVYSLTPNISYTHAGKIEFQLEANIEDALIIKSDIETEYLQDKTAQERNIACSMKSDGKYIIPGTTIKGILRGYCEIILNTLNIKEDFTETLFGTAKDVEGNAQAGRVRVGDCVIEQTNADSELIYHRIKIDRFTGGVMGGALVSEKPVTEGKILMKIQLREFSEVEKNQKAIAILCLTLRDIAMGKVTIGSNAGIGFGRLQGKFCTIQWNKETTKLSFQPSLQFSENSALVKDINDGLEILKKEAELCNKRI